MTFENILELWKKHNGSSYGAGIGTWIISEKNARAFFAELLTDGRYNQEENDNHES